MFLNRKLLYKGKSNKKHNEIINILELNNIKYTVNLRNENDDIGSMINKAIIGNFGNSESYSYEYSIFVSRDDYEISCSLIKDIK